MPPVHSLLFCFYLILKVIHATLPLLKSSDKCHESRGMAYVGRGQRGGPGQSTTAGAQQVRKASLPVMEILGSL